MHSSHEAVQGGVHGSKARLIGRCLQKCSCYHNWTPDTAASHSGSEMMFDAGSCTNCWKILDDVCKAWTPGVGDTQGRHVGAPQPSGDQDGPSM